MHARQRLPCGHRVPGPPAHRRLQRQRLRVQGARGCGAQCGPSWDNCNHQSCCQSHGAVHRPTQLSFASSQEWEQPPSCGRPTGLRVGCRCAHNSTTTCCFPTFAAAWLWVGDRHWCVQAVSERWVLAACRYQPCCLPLNPSQPLATHQQHCIERFFVLNHVKRVTQRALLHAPAAPLAAPTHRPPQQLPPENRFLLPWRLHGGLCALP